MKYLVVTGLAVGALLTLPLLVAALIVAGGPVFGISGWTWRDFLFALFGVIMLASGLAVVTMRDIIRCGLAMIVCFAALAGLYVLLGAPLIAGTQVLVYIGAISVLVLFAIMLTQTKSAPTCLVFQSQAPAAAVAAIILALVIAIVVIGTAWGDVDVVLRTATETLAGILFTDYLLPFEVVSVLLLAAVVGGVYLAKRDEGSGPVIADSLDGYLILAGILFAIGTFGFLARRNAISMLMSIELMLNAVNLSIIAFGAFIPGLTNDASVIALMVIAVAAAEATVGLAIVIAIFRNRGTPLVDEYHSDESMTDDLGVYGPLIVLVLFLPLLGFGVTALVGRRLGFQAHWIPVAAVVLSWLCAMAIVIPALGHAEPFGEHGAGFVIYDWIPAGDFNVEFGLFVDSLTACLLIVVTTVGMLVHVYSIGYMGHDPGYWRFFAYLNLFMFSMLLLVLADSWLTVFVAWELVGLCSYLLIGFWYRRRSAALAAKKAFIVNRVGDVGFALGIMAIFVATGTLNIRESIQLIVEGGNELAISVTVIALLLFAGAVGKSAQFPLHVWLPDAMEGPTPVSALIHAATMVNAGVYLVARASPIFASAPQAMLLVAAIGIFTAILAASIALTQTDIKRVLAYSTLSQLGYMFAALGVGAWTAAIFHLMAHGFFKGLLFLDSGSVIHAVHEEQDMRLMGGLSKKIRITYVTMFIGSLAIAGIPPLAGFFSKDEILGEAFKLGFLWVWAIGIVVALMTAFYMFRLMGLTFWGSFRGPREVWERVHESPPTMTIPLILLAIPSIFFGLVVGLPLGASTIAGWLEPVFLEAAEIGNLHEAQYELFGVDGVLILTSVFVATLGLVIAARLFGWEVGPKVSARPQRVAALTAANGATRFLYRASLNKWWFDEINDLLFIRIGGRLADGVKWFDERVIDGVVVNGTGRVTIWAGDRIRTIQTGRVQNYALGIAIGLLIVAGSFLVIAGQSAGGG